MILELTAGCRKPTRLSRTDSEVSSASQLLKTRMLPEHRWASEAPPGYREIPVKNNPILYLSVIALSSLSGTIHAQDSAYHPALVDNFNLSVGAFRSDHAFNLNAGVRDVPDERIDFNESVGVDENSTIGNLELSWNFGKGRKWIISGQYFSNDANGDATLKEDVVWQDYIFPKGSFVEAGVHLDIIRIFVGRSLIKNERQNLGVGLGIHDLDLSAYIDGEALVGVESTGYRRYDAKFNQPLPNLGVWYDYSPARKWLLHTRLDWIGAKIDEYDGSLWNANIGIIYQPWRNVGFDISYEYFRLDGNVDKSSWYGGLEWSYSGPVMSVTANW
jgi:hypothetical protein